MSVTVTGVDRVNARLADIRSRVATTIAERATMEAADPLIETMKGNIAARTGATRAGIDKRLHEVTEQKVTVRVGPTKRRFIARFLERGTKKMRARPFIGRSADQARPRVIERFRAAVARELTAVGMALR